MIAGKWSISMLMTETVIQQILALQTKNLGELKTLWGTMFDEKPTQQSQQYLVRGLAYRIQEIAHGPLSDKVAYQIERRSKQMETTKQNKRATNKPSAGTVLMRTFQGVEHEVTVTDQGFLYQGQTYKSLSVIARTITGTRWSGPEFFGLRPKKGSRGNKA